MGRTLADDVRDDFSRVFLNTDHFAVELDYTPYGGTLRTIKAQVAGMHGGIREETHHVTNDRTIVVCVRKDATYGVLDPNLRDKLEWEGKTYSFEGIIGESADEFALKFTAVDRERTGNIGAMKQ
jgi:hypothetical protein